MTELRSACVTAGDNLLVLAGTVSYWWNEGASGSCARAFEHVKIATSGSASSGHAMAVRAEG